LLTQKSNEPPKKRAALPPALADILERVSYRRVALEDINDPVYRLRYEAYRREDFIPFNSQRVAGDPYDHSPNVYCYGVYIDDLLVSSIRFHHVTPEMRESPGRSVWPEILGPVLDEGKSYIDPSRFTSDHDASLAFPALPFLTLRLVAMASVHFEADYCISAVRREHAAFYVRVFRSRQIGGLRTFAELKFPMLLYAAEVPIIRDQVYASYPVFMSTEEERDALFGSGAEQSYTKKVRPTCLEAMAS
jgi:hypothetical protein